MSAIAQVPVASANRRRRVRQKVHAPAYASFPAAEGGLRDLYEVLDISELGVSIQCPAPMEVEREVELCLDLAESDAQISGPARVIWSNASGRAGLSLSTLPDPSLRSLRQWLFLNAMAGAANAAAADVPLPSPPEYSAVRPNFTDTLAAVSAVQREAESLGADLEAVLALVAARSQSLLRSSGAAIAITAGDPETMICRASAGNCAPPVGAALHVGSGFSGACVSAGRPLRCDDTETDERVDAETCRALGIRSILAAPVISERSAGKDAIGLIEVFSDRPDSFSGSAAAVLERFADIVQRAVEAERTKSSPRPPSLPSQPAPGSVLFASLPDQKSESGGKTAENADQDNVGGIRLPRAHLYLLVCAAVTIFFALGFILAPFIQPWIQSHHFRGRTEQTVLASSRAPAEAKLSPASESLDAANLDQLRELGEQGDAAAADRLGRIYAEGDDKFGVHPDDSEAARWFTSAAEHGSVSAQYKLGLLYWGGHHGLPKDANKAYFWTVLARAGGQEGSKDLANLLAGGMTRAQAAAIEQQAEIWYQQHEAKAR
ncbi:MAG TPA: GAF domain-containing protein [Candidatus Binatia bacterium]|nr:GAF domain-containing protein [Candidatus Binatia bacterium]